MGSVLSMQPIGENKSKPKLTPREAEGLIMLILITGLLVLPFWTRPVVTAGLSVLAAYAFKYLIVPPLQNRRITFTRFDLITSSLILAAALLIGYFRS
jgi:K+-sensing histidine kinase KdpD